MAMRDRELARLRELDAVLGDVPLPRDLPARIAATALSHSGRRQRAWTLLAVGCAVVLAFALGRRGAPVSSESAEPIAVASAPAVLVVPTPVVSPVVAAASTDPRWWGDRLRAQGPCDGAADDRDAVVLRGECRLVLDAPSMTLDVWDGATVRAVDRGVAVDRGTVQFHVAPVPAGESRARVEVAAGAIEVIGTRFVVATDGDDGHVDLLEGAIAFVDRGGRTHAVAPGERLAWRGAAVIAAPTPIRARADAKRAAPAAIDLDAALQRVAELRRAGRYRDAIAELVALRRQTTDERVAETLSFEEGTLRARIDRSPRVCAFWRGHLARFGAGDHGASIAEHLAAAGCEEP